MAKTNLGVPLGCPLPRYIKERGGGGLPRRGAPIGGVQLGFPILVGVPFLFHVGEGGGVGEGEGKGGCTPCPIGTRGGARAAFLLASLLHSRMAQ